MGMPPVRRTISLNDSDERHDGGIRLLAPEIPFILQSFRLSEQFWIHRRGIDGGADHPHRAAYRVEEGLNSPQPTPLDSNH
jgi:hypothetical protein